MHTIEEGPESSGRNSISGRSSNGSGRNDKFSRSGSGRRRSSLLRSVKSVEDARKAADFLYVGWINSDRSEEALLELLDTSPDLKKLSERNKWFPTVIFYVMENKVGKVSTINTSAESLTTEEATKIGKSLAFSLFCNSSPAAAIEEWLCQFPALAVLEENFPMSEHFFTRLAWRLISDALWGLKFRVTCSAIFGLGEMITDIIVAVELHNNGFKIASRLIMSMVATSLSLQTVISIVQNKKLGLKRICVELFFVMTGLRPALDAYRVAKQKEREKGQPFEPFLELMITRIIEMFAESIPGFVVQLSAIAYGSSVSFAVVSSLALSSISVGVISAMVSYEYDVDPKARYRSPAFYGYVPDESQNRSIIFVLMTILSSSVLFIKSSTLVLLAFSFGGMYLSAFIVADVACFISYKCFKGDFYHWLPLGNISLLGSILVRVMMKTITDFTAIVDFRIPFELGGVYWSFNFFATLIMLPISVNFYESEYGKSFVQGVSLWTCSLVTISLAMLSFSGVVYYTKDEHRNSFWSSQTGVEYCKFLFDDGAEEEDDYIRADAVFSCSREKWRGIEDEVRNWIAEKWDEWRKEEPIWFDEAMQASIPIEFIPSDEDRKTMREKRKTMSFTDRVTPMRSNNSMNFGKMMRAKERTKRILPQ
mmetsp:Transcript_3124/g.6299  ORF Transcript_3124/g.6299 Transcript_3124/m.6299 type:complete len:652 (+) Transcript_3124:124-2079(+)